MTRELRKNHIGEDQIVLLPGKSFLYAFERRYGCNGSATVPALDNLSEEFHLTFLMINEENSDHTLSHMASRSTPSRRDSCLLSPTEPRSSPDER